MRKLFLPLGGAVFLLLLFTEARAQKRDKVLLQQMETAARQGLIDRYYPRNIDSVHGGYLSTFTYDIQPVGAQDKMIVTQARHIWSTSKAAEFYREPAFVPMARHGFQFLRDVMWDSVHGGFHTLVARDGTVKSTGKEAYGNAFAIYGLAAYFKASGDSAALQLAQQTFLWLEANSHDPQYGGYFQNLETNGTPARRTPATPSTSTVGYKDQNSSIHLLEAFTELYGVWKDELVRERLAEMLHLIRDTIVQPKGYLQLYLTADWKPVSFRDSTRESVLRHRAIDHVSFGHDVETAFLLLEAGEALGQPQDARTTEVAKRMVDHALATGWDRKRGGFYDGGYYFRDEPGMTIIRHGKNWWSQAEGLNTLQLFAHLFPSERKKYDRYFRRLWQYTQRYLMDHEHGDWYEEGLDHDPGRRTAHKAHIWKGTYHNFRGLSHCIVRLRNERDGSPADRH
ncbi:MAG TPA: AGE family epimerase/isomerase [Chitinophagaceae bacterium]|nr:AGE family epimerase/isomerase [Chitinophagaceae bacterium]